MSNHEIMLLALGFSLGGYVILLQQILFDLRDARHGRKRLEAAQQKADA